MAVPGASSSRAAPLQLPHPPCSCTMVHSVAPTCAGGAAVQGQAPGERRLLHGRACRVAQTPPQTASGSFSQAPPSPCQLTGTTSSGQPGASTASPAAMYCPSPMARLVSSVEDDSSSTPQDASASWPPSASGDATPSAGSVQRASRQGSRRRGSSAAPRTLWSASAEASAPSRRWMGGSGAAAVRHRLTCGGGRQRAGMQAVGQLREHSLPMTRRQSRQQQASTSRHPPAHPRRRAPGGGWSPHGGAARSAGRDLPPPAPLPQPAPCPPPQR